MKKNIVICSALVMCACATVDSDMPTDRLASINVDELDELVGTWTIFFDENPGMNWEFDDGDVYEIRKKNGKYYLAVQRKMYERDSWKQHKDKEFKLREIYRDTASDYLCADGIKLGGHVGGEKKHVIAFVAKANPSEQLASGDHASNVITCESLDTHGGRAHAQN